jgi:hypothetical protein
LTRSEGHQPNDLYELLDHPRFDPRHEKLLETVRSAYAELLPYQNHADVNVARRAMRLQMELARPEAVLSDPERLRAHDAVSCGDRDFERPVAGQPRHSMAVPVAC